MQESMPLSQLVQGTMEARQQSHRPSDGSAAAGSQPAPGPAEQQALVRYAMWAADDTYVPSFLQQLIDAVEEMEDDTDMKPRAPFPFFADKAHYVSKTQEAAVGTMDKFHVVKYKV